MLLFDQHLSSQLPSSVDYLSTDSVCVMSFGQHMRVFCVYISTDLMMNSPYYRYLRANALDPVPYYSTYRDCYNERLLSPTRSQIIHDRVDRALRRDRSLDRCDRLRSRYPYTVCHSRQLCCHFFTHDAYATYMPSAVGLYALACFLPDACQYCIGTVKRIDLSFFKQRLYPRSILHFFIREFGYLKE